MRYYSADSTVHYNRYHYNEVSQ